MSDHTKIWKLSLLLLLGLFAFLYIFSGTLADIYFTVRDPVGGVSNRFDEESGRTVVERVIPKGPAARAGMLEGDVVVAINGRKIESIADLNDPYSGARVGDEINFLIRRDGREHNISFVALSRARVYISRFLLGLLPGVFFSYTLLIIGLYVLLKRVEDKTTHIFYMMVLFWSLAMWGAFPFGSNAIWKLVPAWLRWTDLFFFPLATGLLLHFTLVFPSVKKTYRRLRPFYLFLCYGSLLPAVVFICARLNHLSWGASFLDISWGIWFSVKFGLAVTMLGYAQHNATSAHKAEQARLMFRGTLYYLAFPTAVYFLPRNFFDYQLPYAEFVLLVMVLWPLSLAYAIVKHRFMDVDFFIKRGVAYALVSGFVVVAYFVLVVGLGRLILLVTGTTSQFLTIVATLIIAFFFNPVKDRIQRFVDRRFFPSKFSYREAIRTFSHQLVKVLELGQLQVLLTEFLTNEMKLRPVALFWLDKDSGDFRVKNSTNLQVESLPAFSCRDAVIAKLANNQQVLDYSALRELPGSLNAEEQARWQLLDTELVLPLQHGDGLIGLISLGPKEGDEAFYKDDLELLDVLSDQINISLANALLTEQLREQERLRKELEVARRIQLDSLPQADPKVPGLDVSGISIPALEVGGDYYDYFTMRDQRFAVVVGDVSGKGTSAALYMSQLKGILKTASRFHDSLRDLFVEVNTVTYESIAEQSFITLTCGLFDLQSGIFKIVRAGHLPMIYYSPSKGVCQEILPAGIGIGLDPGELFRQELEELELQFAAGDTFLFFSDGIVEARNANGEEFEMDAIKELVTQNGCLSAFDLRERIVSSTLAFASEQVQKDDMTLIVVKVVGE